MAITKRCKRNANKKHLKNEPKMYGYNVSFHQTCVESRPPEERYGDYYYDHQNTLTSIRPTEKNPSVVSKHKFGTGESVIVVWAEYSSGDSFGRSDRAHTEVLGVFKAKDNASAMKLKTMIEKFQAYDPSGKMNEFLCTTPDGQRISFKYVPWNDYFSDLNNVHISVVTMGVNYEA